ncbi:MAG TPA: carbohydrate ABC transporter permease [Acidimicrobiales bacterium]|nr:carbohydrate ABC transporter permease [Acidimicrobiales bacterium]
MLGNKRLRRVPLHGVILLVCAIWLVPVVGLVVTSFRPASALLSSGWWVVRSIDEFTLGNFRQALGQGDLGEAFVNSLDVVVPVTVLTVLLGSAAGYAFAWFHFRGERVVFLLVVAMLALPVQVTLVPVLRLLVLLHLAGSFPATWLAYTAYFLPFAVFLMRTFIGKIPRETLEAARVDGASTFATWGRIVLPMAAPALASLATLVFVWTWNDLLVALVDLGADPSVAPLQVAIADLVGQQSEGLQLLAAGAVLSLLLPLVVFLVLQRYFVRGLSAGALR